MCWMRQLGMLEREYALEGKKKGFPSGGPFRDLIQFPDLGEENPVGWTCRPLPCVSCHTHAHWKALIPKKGSVYLKDTLECFTLMERKVYKNKLRFFILV